jgi:hypothetical protein
LVRVLRLAEPLVFPDAPKYGGCRSWIEVPDAAAAAALTPVLDEAAHCERSRELLGVIG